MKDFYKNSTKFLFIFKSQLLKFEYLNFADSQIKTELMKFSIGNDHAGTEYKNKISAYLKSRGFEVINHGTDSNDSVDYPDFVHPVAKDVSDKSVDFGIIICGSGNGANMTANKHQSVRSALSWNQEVTALARQHNDANILSIPARFVTETEALEFVKIFINTDFEGGRHQRRVDKIACQ